MTEKYVKGKMIELIRYAAKMNKDQPGSLDAVVLSPTEYEHLVRDLDQVYLPSRPGYEAREMLVSGVKVTTTGV